MARFKSNLIAGMAGAGWTAIMQLACIPLLVRFLGAEAYGLIAFFLTLQVSLQILDLGLSATLNREMAGYSTQPARAAEARDFLKTMQAVNWAIGLGLGLGVIALAPAISAHWVQARSMSLPELRDAIRLMGLVLLLQWPLGFYQAGLIGLQQIVRLNIVRIAGVSISLGGAVLAMWLGGATLRHFFEWQIFASAAQVSATAITLWTCMPPGQRSARFDASLLRGVLRFAGGVGGIAALGALLTQMDKIVLSKLLPLADFGYYSLAAIVASSLQLFITPVFSVVFPRLSSAVARDNTDEVRRVYHMGTQVMSSLVLPTAMVLAAFAPLGITLWSGDPALAATVAPISVLLLAGTAINGLMNLPYALQLAYGWTRLGLGLALFSFVAFAPLLIWSAGRYGAVGGAATWAALNICYFALGIPLTHRRLLRGEMKRWLFTDVGRPLAAVLVVVVAARLLLGINATGWRAALELAGVAVVALSAAGLAAPEVRRAVLGRDGFAAEAANP
jgi:O-antigen/teichoic acid export membrane protein